MMTIKELEDKIKFCAQKYYSKYPIVSDTVFDLLVDELRNLDPDNELLTMTGWGYDPTKVEFGIKVNHKYGKVIGITNKPRTIDAIPLNLRASNTRVRISAKLDGLSCILYYNNGEFVQAVTRGNGEIGIDITSKINYICRNDVRYRNIPGFSGSIRGELVIPCDKWMKSEMSKDSTKNPRNYASGIINRHDISDELDLIDLCVYKITAWENCEEYLTSQSMSEKLACYFEHTVDNLITSASNVTEDKLKELFDIFNKHYPCDGCVITNDIIKFTVKDPDMIYDEVAFKFESERAIARIDHIEWNLSRTGMMKPVACIDPVTIAGTTVSRCTCFNAKYVIDNSLGKDALIEIEKSGEIIPDIQSIVKSANSPDIPNICPRCGSKLELVGADLKCVNKDCLGTSMSDLHHWTNVIAEVDGLGGKIKEDFFTKHNINSVEDLYAKLPDLSFGNSATDTKLYEMSNKLINSYIEMTRALVALSIPRLSWRSAEKIVESGLFVDLANSPEIFGTDAFDELSNKLDKVVGQATRKSIELNMNKVERLKFLKGRIVMPKSKVDNNVSESKGIVVITGRLNSGTRKEFELTIKSAGYELGDKITKDTLYLITNTPNSGSSKNKKADELGVEKITEEEFINLLNA